jgi:hypothetical protein
VKRLLALSLIAAPLPAPAQDPGPFQEKGLAAEFASAEAEKILRVVISFHGRGRDKSRYCVKRTLSEPTFASLPRKQGPPGKPTPRTVAADIGLGEVSWLERATNVGDLDAREAARIVEAINAIFAGPPLAHPVRAIQPSWLPIPLGLCRGHPIEPYLEIYAPTLRSGYAFVETQVHCTFCGAGQLYALKRDPHGWRIVGENLLWVN